MEILRARNYLSPCLQLPRSFRSSKWPLRNENKGKKSFTVLIFFSRDENGNRFEYTAAKDQEHTEHNSKEIYLKAGTYKIYAEVEVDYSFAGSEVEVSLWSYSPQSVFIRTGEDPRGDFLTEVYRDCAIKNGDKSNLGDDPNASSSLIIYQYFNEEDSTYIQHFRNECHDITWHHTVEFRVINSMRVLGFDDYKKIELTINKRSSKTIVIKQTGAGECELDGGEGYYTLKKG
mmetsp:Transcript_44255/g.50931  ORF Transcript_44255/g.50931 Transcript_44255/m.50931 type:complete len:232 (+) Transcript_44255:2542-3237(+)